MLKLQCIPKKIFGQSDFVCVGYIQAYNLSYFIKKSLMVIRQFYSCLAFTWGLGSINGRLRNRWILYFLFKRLRMSSKL